jgi:hypothetical protein
MKPHRSPHGAARRTWQATALGAWVLCLLCLTGCQQADRVGNAAPTSATTPVTARPQVDQAKQAPEAIEVDDLRAAGGSFRYAAGAAAPENAPAVDAPMAPPAVQAPMDGLMARVPPGGDFDPGGAAHLVPSADANAPGRARIGWLGNSAPPPPPGPAPEPPSEKNEEATGAQLADKWAATETPKTEKKKRAAKGDEKGRDFDERTLEPADDPEPVVSGKLANAKAPQEVALDGSDGAFDNDRDDIADAEDLAEEDAEEARETEYERNDRSRGGKSRPKPKRGKRALGDEGRFGRQNGKELSNLGGLETNYYASLDEGETTEVRPTEFLPRTCYVSNTYLGGRAAHVAALSALDDRLSPTERPYAEAGLPPQAFDGPDNAGISLSTRLDRAWLDTPGRVYLQVGLRGSDRHGWRRPPLDLVLVLDATVANAEAQVLALTTGLMRRLGPQDRLGVVVADGNAPQVLASVDTLRTVRPILAQRLGEGPLKASLGDGVALAAGLAEAGLLLDAAAEGQARVPGTQVVLLAVSGDPQRTDAARAAAHQLTLQGAVVSVAALDGAAQWWGVADAGHGSLHRGPQVEAHLDAEMAGLSRVVARLLRLDIKLGDKVSAVRVLGAEVLGAREVARVKAREEAVDARLAKTTGLKADRGDDGEGIQIVVPWFAGGDSHVVLVELWVDEPGPVAEVTLKYKDMVALNNGTARSSVALPRTPHNLTASQRGVRRNVAGFQLAEALQAAGQAAARGQLAQARGLLRAALPPNPADRAVVLGFVELLDRRPAPLVAEALQVAAERRVGTPASARGAGTGR